jgi:hypothetical protein
MSTVRVKRRPDESVLAAPFDHVEIEPRRVKLRRADKKADKKHDPADKQHAAADAYPFDQENTGTPSVEESSH